MRYVSLGALVYVCWKFALALLSLSCGVNREIFEASADLSAAPVRFAPLMRC